MNFLDMHLVHKLYLELFAMQDEKKKQLGSEYN